jgi:Na+-transporting NADH:ubiquinone oxidoreductase subunit C
VQQYSTTFIFGFTFAVCLLCSLFISFAAVSLHDKQETNKRLHRLKSVLAAGHIGMDEPALTQDVVNGYFLQAGETLDAAREEPLLVAHVLDLQAGEEDSSVPAHEFKPEDAARMAAPGNAAGLPDIPEKRLIFHVMKAGKFDGVILPVEGKGLWSTLQGYIALDADMNTVEGLTYYAHGETPGLGGEVDNPLWKNRWQGRKMYEDGRVALQVIKGSAPDADVDPYKVDGLSGATITSRGVSNMMAFWFGEEGYRTYLDKLRAETQAP